MGVSNISDLERGGRLANLFFEQEESSSGLIELLFGGGIAGVVAMRRTGVETSFAGVESIPLVFADGKSSFVKVPLTAISLGVEGRGGAEKRRGGA